MNCPNCGGKTYIIDVRPSEKYDACLRRRRMCYRCKNRFTTYEVLPMAFSSGEKAKDILKRISDYMKEVTT